MAKWIVQGLNSLGLSAITISRLCKTDATKRKIEHMPNITVMGNASTLRGKTREREKMRF